MLSIQEVNNAIAFGHWTNEQLTSMIDAIKYNRNLLVQAVKHDIRVGDNVEFTSSKSGRLVRGFVTKKAIKYITVDTGMDLWRVPANMLSKVD
jgi:hypothetical protein